MRRAPESALAAAGIAGEERHTGDPQGRVAFPKRLLATLDADALHVYFYICILYKYVICQIYIYVCLYL